MARSLFLLTAGTLVILTSCGGGGSDSSGSGAPIAAIEIGAGDTSPAADTVATEVLQQRAASNAARAIGANMAGARTVSTDANTLVGIASDATFSANSAWSTSTLLNDGFGLDVIAPVDSDDPLEVFSPETVDTLDIDTDRLLLATLGLDASGLATASREGNRIIIDPDDQAVCEGEVFIGDDHLQQCLELIKDLTVQLDAVTEQSGQITYLYQGRPLLEVIYGPNAASYELDLGTYFNVESAAAAFLNQAMEVASMSGKVRLVMHVENANSGNESGTVTLAVPEPIAINDVDGSQLSLAASNIFTMTSDAATGTASIELGMGALRMLMTDPLGGADSTFSMAGLRGVLSFDEQTEGLTVSNFSFAGAPLRMNIDGVTAQVSLSPLGFIASGAGNMVLSQALNLSVSASANDPEFGSATVALRASAPAGTRITDSDLLSETVTAGGPLSLNYSVTGGEGSANGLITLAPGSCQNTASNDLNNPLQDFISCQ